MEHIDKGSVSTLMRHLIVSILDPNRAIQGGLNIAKFFNPLQGAGEFLTKRATGQSPTLSDRFRDFDIFPPGLKTLATVPLIGISRSSLLKNLLKTGPKTRAFRKTATKEVASLSKKALKSIDSVHSLENLLDGISTNIVKGTASAELKTLARPVLDNFKDDLKRGTLRGLSINPSTNPIFRPLNRQNAVGKNIIGLSPKQTKGTLSHEIAHGFDSPVDNFAPRTSLTIQRLRNVLREKSKVSLHNEGEVVAELTSALAHGTKEEIARFKEIDPDLVAFIQRKLFRTKKQTPLQKLLSTSGESRGLKRIK